MELIEIINKLIGPIEPYGDTNIDKERCKNADILGEITVDLVYMIAENSKYRNRPEYSMKKIGEMAYEDLMTIKEYIEAELEGD